MCCRIRRRTEWTTRLYHEMGYHNDSKFVTLTYELSPVTLNPSDLQKFIKRYRKDQGCKCKYYAVGEYGSITNRPHYHLILFSDLPIKDSDIRKNWGLGITSTDDCNRETIQYVAGYIEKKLLGNDAVKYKEAGLYPPFSRASQGLGKSYIEANARQIKENLDITINGKSVGIPRYYRLKLGISKTDLLGMVSEKQASDNKRFNELGVTSEIEKYMHIKKSSKQRELNAISKLNLKNNAKI